MTSDRLWRKFLKTKFRRKRINNRRRFGDVKASTKPYRIRNKDILKVSRTKTFELSFPACCDLAKNPEPLVVFLKVLNRHIFKDQAKEILLDHSTIEEITPEAALVLIAEFERLTVYSKCRLKTHQNEINHHVLDILGRVGYLDHFKFDHPKKVDKSRIILRHTQGRKSYGQSAAKLIDHFKAAAGFPAEFSGPLYDAFVECMDNVSGHAYEKPMADRLKRRLWGHWWMIGYRNLEENRITFAFFDQGIGLGNSIRQKWASRMKLAHQTNAELVVRAMNGGFSKTGDSGRGRGMRTFRRLIERSKEGKLIINTWKTIGTAEKGGSPIAVKQKNALEGTLVVWKIRL